MVLIEALACGVPVVSTDCKSGPREILEDGKYGKLVTAGDALLLSEAIIEMVKNPKPSKEVLQERAKDFSLENSIEKYQRLIKKSSDRLDGG